MNTLHLIRLQNVDIYEQLRLEEALLRADTRNFCLINHGSPPAIVMGLSGNPAELIYDHADLPLIKRFSGGGTVVVDEDTLFVTFIFNDTLLPLPPFPESLLKWAASFYAPTFTPHPFGLNAQDFVIGNLKVGGNAQYIRKGRYLHHTSFLWDWSKQRMETLRYPPKTPVYRQGRSHEEFLTPMKRYFPSKEHWLNRLIEQLHANFVISECLLENVQEALKLPHRKSLARRSLIALPTQI